MVAKISAANMPYWPAAMTQQMAAAYCGLSVGTFTAVCPVLPIVYTSSKSGRRYLRVRLDEWLMSLDHNEPIERMGMGSAYDARPRMQDRAADIPPRDDSPGTRMRPSQEKEFQESLRVLEEMRHSGTKIIYHGGYLMSEDDFSKHVLSKPMGKRERQALAALHQQGGEAMWGEIKASDTTQQTLEVRGYVVVAKDGDRPVSWRITEAGIAAVENGLTAI